MKLYKLFNDIIIEETKKRINLLTEGVDVNNVRDAIDNMYMVNVMYRPEEDNVLSKRYIAVYNLGKTKAGNDAIRVYQVYGGNRKKNGWKTFRLDRIESWEPTGMRWYNPISDYDPNIPTYKINQDKTFSILNKSVDPNNFGKSRSLNTNADKTPSTAINKNINKQNIVKIPEPEPDDDFIPEPDKNIEKPKVKVPTSISPKKVKTELPSDETDDEPNMELDTIDNDNENNL